VGDAGQGAADVLRHHYGFCGHKINPLLLAGKGSCAWFFTASLPASPDRLKGFSFLSS
jgi:hypothetical protein